MNRIILIIGILISFTAQSQVVNDDGRIDIIKKKLEKLAESTPGLKEKVNLDIKEAKLSIFLGSLGRETEVNIVVDKDLQNKKLSYNLPDAKFIDFLIYLIKEFDLSVEITGDIIALKKRTAPLEIKKPFVSRDIFVEYTPNSELFSLELKGDSLSVAFKKITDVTGKNLVYAPNIADKKISGYIKNKPFDNAMEKLAFANNLELIKTKDDFYLFQSREGEETPTIIAGRNNQSYQGAQSGKQTPKVRPVRYKKSNLYYKILDPGSKKLEVDFENAPIEDIIQEIGYALNIDFYTDTPLKNIGSISMKASNIDYDELLTTILENVDYTYKKRYGIYFFGKTNDKSLKVTEVIPFMHRSIEVMNQPISGGRNSVFASSFTGNLSSRGTNGLNNRLNNSRNIQSGNFGGNGRQFNNANGFTSRQQSVGRTNGESVKQESILGLFPDYLGVGGKNGGGTLDVKADVEQNAFIVSGDPQRVKKFKEFVKKIDKPVPVILIEVMILEINKSNSLTAGVELGVGDKPTASTGKLFPAADVTLGANAINRLIDGFNGFGHLNVGKVVPNFYAKIQALETNGNVKIKSTPKLSTLNGHTATLSSGETSYYAVTQSNVLGVQNPQTQVIRNYLPIDANLSISIRPLMAGDEQITLGINVIQSSFNGKRIDPEAPPGINSREFTSAVRVKNQDVVILGGLEENVKNDSGSGVPFLARIPIIKWLFSKRTRTATKSKLSVLIRPTIIR